MNIIDELADFIKETKESKEIKRALAVKMILEGKSYQEVKALLKVSHSFISQWKNQALFQGVESLKLQYKGRQGYLKPEEKYQTIQWLREQEHLRLSDLQNYLQEQYDVVFESNQSYYSVRIQGSWKSDEGGRLRLVLAMMSSTAVWQRRRLAPFAPARGELPE